MAAAKKLKFSPPAIAKISTRILEIDNLNREKNNKYIEYIIKLKRSRYIILYFIVAIYLAAAASLSLNRRVKSSYLSTSIWAMLGVIGSRISTSIWAMRMAMYGGNRRSHIHVTLGHGHGHTWR